MNTVVTSRNDILEVAKAMVSRTNAMDINIRMLATECGISVGAVYYYFPSKGDLLSALVGSIWQEIMEDFMNNPHPDDLLQTISALFEAIHRGSDKFPSFFNMHSVGFSSSDKQKGRIAMDRYLGCIKDMLSQVLEADTRLRTDAFNDALDSRQFVDFVFANLMAMMVRKEQSCALLLEIVRRTVM